MLSQRELKSTERIHREIILMVDLDIGLGLQKKWFSMGNFLL